MDRFNHPSYVSVKCNKMKKQNMRPIRKRYQSNFDPGLSPKWG